MSAIPLIHSRIRVQACRIGPRPLWRQTLRSAHVSSATGVTSPPMSNESFVVPERAYLELRGVDAKTFLQGVTTNDTSSLRRFGDCMATAFLTPKGRVLADAIIYDISPSQTENTAVRAQSAEGAAVTGGETESVPTLLLETHVSMHEPLARFLSMYKLRAKVKIHSSDKYHTVVGFNQVATARPSGGSAATAVNAGAGSGNLTTPSTLLIGTPDPRHPSLGSRFIYRSPEKWAGQDPNTASMDRSRHSRYRMLHCLAEGGELEGRIPMEANLDLLGYISYKKGCYVGQELVARTKHKGLVRKRLVPFIRTLSASGGGSSSHSTADADSGEKFELLPEGVARAILGSSSASASPIRDQVRPGALLTLNGDVNTGVGDVVAVSISEDMGIVKAALVDVYGGKRKSIVTSGNVALPIKVFRPRWWPDEDPITHKRLDDPSTF